MTLRLLGLAEVAERLGRPRATVRQMHHRGQLPPPDQTLAMGPVWTEDTINTWLADQPKGP